MHKKILNRFFTLLAIPLLAAALLTSAWLPNARAATLDELTFPDQITLAGTNTPLQLNGVGWRTKFVFRIYAGALYTEKKVHSFDEVKKLTGPNRVLMHFVYSEVGRDKLRDAWIEGFEENTSAAQFRQLKARIDTFNAMFPDLKEGDVVLLDYIPGYGTQVTIKGEVKGVIEGRDFNQALLAVWLGEEPADDDLKEAMLGQE